MEVCVEEDKVDVTLQILEALQEQRLTRLLRLRTFNLKKKHRNIYVSVWPAEKHDCSENRGSNKLEIWLQNVNSKNTQVHFMFQTLVFRGDTQPV